MDKSSVILDVRRGVRIVLSYGRGVIQAHSANLAVQSVMERHMVDAAIEEIDKFDVDDSKLDKLESLLQMVASQAAAGDDWCRDVLTSLGLQDAEVSGRRLSTGPDLPASPRP